jgi:hypothetical protein
VLGKFDPQIRQLKITFICRSSGNEELGLGKFDLISANENNYPPIFAEVLAMTNWGWANLTSPPRRIWRTKSSPRSTHCVTTIRQLIPTIPPPLALPHHSPHPRPFFPQRMTVSSSRRPGLWLTKSWRSCTVRPRQ